MRVLFLTHRLPYAPNRGDRMRAFGIVQALAPNVDLEVASLVHSDHELAQVDRVREIGARVTAFRVPRVRNYVSGVARLFGNHPLTLTLLHAPALSQWLRGLVAERRPDVVLAFCSSMAQYALESPLRNVPLVVDFVDVDSAKWAALAPTERWPKSWIFKREQSCLSRFEGELARRAVASLVVSERERTLLRQIAPDAPIHVVRLGVDIEALRPPSAPSDAPRLVFCGVMNYQPNVDGVLWFVREVWPEIRKLRPSAEFLIVGSDPAPSIRSLGAVPGVAVTGTVPDVRQYLWSAAVSVAPLIVARGVQNKVLEALAAGLPAVVTPEVMAGLPEQARAGCLVGESSEAFARHVHALLTMTGDQRRALAARVSVDDLSSQAQLRPLLGILEGAARSRRAVSEMRPEIDRAISASTHS